MPVGELVRDHEVLEGEVVRDLDCQSVFHHVARFEAATVEIIGTLLDGVGLGFEDVFRVHVGRDNKTRASAHGGLVGNPREGIPSVYRRPIAIGVGLVVKQLVIGSSGGEHPRRGGIQTRDEELEGDGGIRGRRAPSASNGPEIEVNGPAGDGRRGDGDLGGDVRAAILLE